MNSTVIIGSFLAILFMLALSRKLFQIYVKQKFEYRVFALRDRLRMLAIDGKLDPRSWEFSYTDNTLSKSIESSYYITLLSVTVFSMRAGDDPRQKEFRDKFNDMLDKSPDLKALFNDHAKAMVDYVFGQHLVTYQCILKPLLSIFIGAGLLRRRVESLVNRVLIVSDNNPNSQDYSYS